MYAAERRRYLQTVVDLIVWSTNLSAIGVSDWYLFQMRYSFDSSLGASGRNVRLLPGAVFTRCSKESWYPSPSRTNREAL